MAHSPAPVNKDLTPLERTFVARVLYDAAHELASLNGSRSTYAANDDTLTPANAWEVTVFDLSAACVLAAQLLVDGLPAEHHRDMALDLKQLAESRQDHQLLARIERWRSAIREAVARREAQRDAMLVALLPDQSETAPNRGHLDQVLTTTLYGARPGPSSRSGSR